MKRISNQSRTFIRWFICISIILVGLNVLPIRSTYSAISSLDLEIDLSLIPHAPISIISDIGLKAFPGSGIEEDPFLIEGYNITASSSTGIFITGTTKYFTIRNCYIETISLGINIDSVADGTVTVFNNTCNQNSLVGISLYAARNSSIINNTCNYNDLYGIMLISSGDSTIANNTCENNDQYGIYLYASGDSTIANNTCYNNGIDGIELSNSDGCFIIFNLLQENGVYGVAMTYGSDNNTIHHNTFVDNNDDPYGGSQAGDSGISNTWYDTDTFEGNYWDDWSGTGNYSIDGTAGSFDPYPLDEYGNPPIISEFSSNIIVLILVFVFSLVIIPLSLITRKKLKNR